MARLAYYRVSTADQSIKSQRHALGGQFEHEFSDETVSGATRAQDRPGFAGLLAFAREGDSVHVYSVDRLGRDAIDVQTTVRQLMDKGVSVNVHGIGEISRGAGELILAVLAQIAEIERRRIRDRTAAGRDLALQSLAATGRTHRGKKQLGRGKTGDPAEVAGWRSANAASLSATAERFALSVATVKRYCAHARQGAHA